MKLFNKVLVSTMAFALLVPNYSYTQVEAAMCEVDAKPLDIIIVQDTSASFSEQKMNVVKNTLTKIADGLNPETIEEGNVVKEADRMMVVSYQGRTGSKDLDGTTRSTTTAPYTLNVENLTGLSSDKTMLKNQINSIVQNGSTPTASGLKKALEDYKTAVTSEVDPETGETGREAVFVLITDGVANVREDGYLYYDHNAMTSSSYPSNTERVQDYQAAIGQSVTRGEAIKAEGYKFITSLMEDVAFLTKSDEYPDNYSTVGTYSKNALRNMASLDSNGQALYVEDSNNSSVFAEKLISKIGQETCLELPMEYVHIPDNVLRQHINNYIRHLDSNQRDKGLNSEITYEDMARLVNFDILDYYDRNLYSSHMESRIAGFVTNLEGLQHATNLEVLRTGQSRLTSLAPLSNSTKLKILVSEGNTYEDLSPLNNSLELDFLGLGSNRINDASLATLGNLPKLRRLEMYNNRISDLTNLPSLPNLRNLNLSSNLISDVSVIKFDEMVQLQQLYITHNRITDISNFANAVGHPISGFQFNASSQSITKNSVHTEDGTIKIQMPIDIEGMPMNGRSWHTLNPSEGGAPVEGDMVWTEQEVNGLKTLYWSMGASYPFSGSITQPYTTSYVKPAPVPEPTPAAPPTINASNHTIDYGAEFDIREHVTATSSEGRELRADEIEFFDDNGNPFVLNSKLSGSNIVWIRATDTELGLTTEQNIFITVSPVVPTIVAGNHSVEYGSDYTLTDHVTLLDPNREVIDHTVRLIKNGNTYELDTTIVGPHPVTVEYTFDGGKTLTHDIVITVLEEDKGSPPVVEADDQRLERGTRFEPMNWVTAYDENDGNLTDIEITFNNVDVETPGIYQIEYTAKNSRNLMTAKTIDVEVYEAAALPPVVEDEEPIVEETVPVEEEKTEETPIVEETESGAPMDDLEGITLVPIEEIEEQIDGALLPTSAGSDLVEKAKANTYVIYGLFFVLFALIAFVVGFIYRHREGVFGKE